MTRPTVILICVDEIREPTRERITRVAAGSDR
jgi:hypothetical protein